MAQALTCALLLVCPGLALAEEHTPMPGERGGPRVSLGAGLGAGGWEFGSLLGIGGLGGGGYVAQGVAAPVGTALVEVAVTKQLRLFAGLNGSYQKRLGKRRDLPEGTVRPHGWSAGLGFGARWVLNPGGIVEVAPALLIGLRKAQSFGQNGSEYADGEQLPIRIDNVTTGLDGRLGLVLERALLPNLYVRFESYFFRAGISHFQSRRVSMLSGVDRVDFKEVELTWGFSPSLQLRLAF